MNNFSSTTHVTFRAKWHGVVPRLMAQIARSGSFPIPFQRAHGVPELRTIIVLVGDVVDRVDKGLSSQRQPCGPRYLGP